MTTWIRSRHARTHWRMVRRRFCTSCSALEVRRSARGLMVAPNLRLVLTRSPSLSLPMVALLHPYPWPLYLTAAPEYRAASSELNNSEQCICVFAQIRSVT